MSILVTPRLYRKCFLFFPPLETSHHVGHILTWAIHPLSKKERQVQTSNLFKSKRLNSWNFLEVYQNETQIQLELQNIRIRCSDTNMRLISMFLTRPYKITFEVKLSSSELTPWAWPTLEDYCWPQANPWPGLLTQWKT